MYVVLWNDMQNQLKMYVVRHAKPAGDGCSVERHAKPAQNVLPFEECSSQNGEPLATIEEEGFSVSRCPTTLCFDIFYD